MLASAGKYWNCILAKLLALESFIPGWLQKSLDIERHVQSTWQFIFYKMWTIRGIFPHGGSSASLLSNRDSNCLNTFYFPCEPCPVLPPLLFRVLLLLQATFNIFLLQWLCPFITPRTLHNTLESQSLHVCLGYYSYQCLDQCTTHRNAQNSAL